MIKEISSKGKSVPWHTRRARCWSPACEHRFQVYADAHLVSCPRCHKTQRPDAEPVDEVWAVYIGSVAA